MAESEAPATYVEARGAELLQLAALAGEFYTALSDLKLPESITHALLVEWFTSELENGGTDDDDD